MPEPNFPLPPLPGNMVSPAPAAPPPVPLPQKGFNPLIVLLLLLVFGPLGWFLGTRLKMPSFSPQAPTASASPQAPAPAPGKEIVIGGILPLTGDAASYGIPIQQAATLGQKEINDQGGIGGRQIKFIWKDGRCEKNDAKLAAEQLVNEEKVDFLLGGACSSEFLNAAPVAQAQKIITWSSSATSPKISELGKYIFRTCPSDALAGKAAAGYAYNKWGAKTAGVIAEEKDYTLALKDVFTQNFTELGGKVVMTETFPTGTTDFATASAKVKNLNPDMVYILPQTPTPGVLLVKTLKAQGVKSKILTAEVLLIRDAVAEQGQILEGVTGIEALFDETRPQTKKFIELFKKEYNLDLNWPSYMAGMYDILYLIKGAYEAGGPSNGSGAKTADEVASWLYNLKKWEGAVGDLQFDSHGDPTMTYSIRQINNFSAPQVDTYVP